MDFEGPEDPDIHTESARTQLNEYFEGKRSIFHLTLHPIGTEFELKVWNEVNKIPATTTNSYGEIAKKLGSKNKAQAVGNAIGKNPIMIVIPCHRVLGVNNNISGYSGGIHRKEWLLKHEKILLL